MRKFLATLLSVVLALTVFALVGCDKKADLKITDVMEKLDASNGCTVTLDLDLNAEGEKVALDGKIKTLKNNEGVDLDVEVEIDENGSKENGKLYVRGNDIYISDEDGKFIKQSIEEMLDDMLAGMNITVSEYIGYLMGSTENLGGFNNKLIDDEVVFYKKNGELKAEVDAFAIVVRVLNKVNGVVDILDADTTVKQIYNKIDGDKLLDKLFGDVKGKDFYKEVIDYIKSMPIDSENPAMGGIIASLPTDVDAFIEMVNTMVGLNLPKMEDKTVKQFLKEFISNYNDMTILDIALNLSEGELPDDQKAAMKEQINAMLKSAKEEIKPKLEKLITLFKADKCKFTIVAQSDGTLNEIAADISISKALMEHIDSMGGKAPVAEQPAVTAFSLTFSAKFDYTAPQMADVSKLEIVDVEAEMKAYFISMVLSEAQEKIKEEAIETDEGYYVSANVVMGEVSDLTVVTLAPEDATNYTEAGTCIETETGYAVYIFIKK